MPLCLYHVYDTWCSESHSANNGGWNPQNGHNDHQLTHFNLSNAHQLQVPRVVPGSRGDAQERADAARHR
jgi:hypothetical protein